MREGIDKHTSEIIIRTIKYYQHFNCFTREQVLIDQLMWRIEEALKNNEVYRGDQDKIWEMQCEREGL